MVRLRIAGEHVGCAGDIVQGREQRCIGHDDLRAGLASAGCAERDDTLHEHQHTAQQQHERDDHEPHIRAVRDILHPADNRRIHEARKIADDLIIPIPAAVVPNSAMLG